MWMKITIVPTKKSACKLSNNYDFFHLLKIDNIKSTSSLQVITCYLMGSVLDHVIIGEGYFSFFEEGEGVK